MPHKQKAHAIRFTSYISTLRHRLLGPSVTLRHRLLGPCVALYVVLGPCAQKLCSVPALRSKVVWRGGVGQVLTRHVWAASPCRWRVWADRPLGAALLIPCHRSSRLWRRLPLRVLLGHLLGPLRPPGRRAIARRIGPGIGCGPRAWCTRKAWLQAPLLGPGDSVGLPAPWATKCLLRKLLHEAAVSKRACSRGSRPPGKARAPLRLPKQRA